jgi:pilus assembly protein CpaB
MKNARHLALAIGILLALGTGVMLLNYVGSVRSSSASASPTRAVLVAARDIPARALLTDAYYVKTEKPVNDVDSDAASDPKQLVGKYSLINIPAGSVISKSKVSSAAANALPARLPVGMRAVSISIDRVKGVAGLIQPGDRVDVIAVPPRMGSEVPQASAILRGVLVLAMGNEVETTSATPAPENQNLTTVTLALTPAQVDLLAAADLNTTLRLALRPPKESIRAFPAEPLTLGVPQRSFGVQNVTVPPPAPAAVPVRAQPPVVRTGVTVIDGDHVADYGTYHP